MSPSDRSARLDARPSTATLAELEVQAFLDAAVDAMIVIDDQGTIRQFSLAAQRMFGYESHEVLGRNVQMLMPEPFRSEHGSHLERYARTGEAHIIGTRRRVSAQRKDASVFPCELAVGRVQGTDPPHFVGFIRDVTDRQRDEDEARLLRVRLTQFSRLSTMGEMAAGLAHEINQPLTAIATYAQACQRLLAQQHPEDAIDDVRTALEQISQQSLRAGEVIRRLRNFVRNREVKRESVDCRRLLDELSTLAGADARLHDVTLRIDCASDLPVVHADAVQLQQVVLNLVRNAIDAMADVPAAQREINLSAGLNSDGDVEIAVSDRGPGLSPQAVEQLFRPFFTTKLGGTGLGLAISLSIVRAHGGRLWYTPAQRGGARLQFTLPVAPTSLED
jgi:two-component system sensor kinase FixL